MKQEKQITRTITTYTGNEIVADYETMTFKAVPFAVYDEADIPANARDVSKFEAVYAMSISDFITHGKVISK